jgi:exopolysaccharide biosynthesis protein
MLIKSIYIAFGLLLGFSAHAQSWKMIGPGIEYLDLDRDRLPQWSHIHAFRLDMQYQELGVVLAKDTPSQNGSAPNFKRYSHSLIAINGGFFTPKREPIGLRISNHQVLNPLKLISWWGVFSIQNQRASITSPYDFHHHNNIDFAIQAGPRLLIAKKIPALKPGFANRTALGITANGQVILLVTENLPITTTELAKIMRKQPLNCIDALNLDGGGSTQLFAHMRHFHLDVPGFSQVSDAVVVKPR